MRVTRRDAARWLSTAAVIVALPWALALVGCGRHGAASDAGDEGASGSAATARVPVTVGVVEQSDIELTLDVAGVVVPAADGSAVLRAPAAGVVRAIPAPAGTAVRRGDAIVDLDTPELGARVIEFDAAATLAAQQARRSAALLADGIVAARDNDEAQAAASTARGKADAAHALLRGARGLSPLGGVVQRIDVHVGDRVAEGDVLGEVVDPHRLEFQAPLAADAATRIQSGAGAVLEAGDPTVPMPVRGVVAGITPSLDPLTQSRMVRVRFTGDGATLIAGRTYRASLRLDTLRGALSVPDSAIVHAPAGTEVFLVSADSVAHATLVSVRGHVARRTAVVGAMTGSGGSMLRSGARVVATGASGLSDGMRVAPVRRAAAASVHTVTSAAGARRAR